MPIIGSGGILYVDSGGGGGGGITYGSAVGSNSGASDSSSPWSPTMPGSISNGNLLIAVVSADGGTGTAVTASTGWTALDDDNQFTAIAGDVFYRVADGGANDTLTVTPSAAEQLSAVVVRISGGSSWALQSISANNASYDPPSLDTGSTEETLWLACLCLDSNDSPTAPPAGYSDLVVGAASGTNSVTTATAYKISTAQTEDPGAFTITTSEQNVLFTVSVRLA